MRRVALLILGAGALLLTPGATGVPDVVGDPTPPVVTPVIIGTLGDAGWYTSNVTVNWTVVDPESIILSTSGCDARTLTTDTTGTPLTCSAESDGGTTTVGKTFKLDKTAPAANATPSRSPDANGWYNHELTVGFAGTDATSGLEACSGQQPYGGPDTPGTSVTGTCRDRAGNTRSASLPLKYDETSPQASPAARLPDANGWYNHAVTVTFQGADGTSGVESCTQATYAGPDDASVALSGSCVDRAGNQSPSSGFMLKYDETAPQASATTRVPDVNGWHNHSLTVTYAGSDATSGLDVCDPPRTYSGPDSANAVVSGSCRDFAGNVAPRSVSVKYDATAPGATATPSRQPNANGWYNAALTVAFAGTDVTSGIDSCSAPKGYSGPDSSAAALSGTCLDQAGNTGAASFSVKYDATAPQTTAAAGRPADANGWYNHALAITFAGTDARSGIESCDAATSYSGPDTSSATASGSCRDRAGNSTPNSFTFKYDATAPQAAAAPSRQPGANGWYNAPLGVTFTGSDVTSGLESCDPAKTYSGPDAASANVTGICLDKAGNSRAASFLLKYDATAPAATAAPSRQPNANGWFNAPFTVTFSATDATSTVDTCDAAKSYSGPDHASAAVNGTCRDKAGNSGAASFALKYDATAPAATAAPSRQPNANGWFNSPLTVSFAATDGTSGVDTCTQPRSYGGPDDAEATVSGTCADKAGNADVASLGLKYDATAPQATATPSRQPNANGWFNAPLTVNFAGTDAMSTIASCDGAKSYSGPDDGAASVSGACRDKAGNVDSAAFVVKYDTTSPQTTASPSRQPNANGWYNAPLTVGFAATDATSTVDSCDPAKSYAGPDAASTQVAGSCRDKAGNAGAASFPLKYDGTAPQVTANPSRQPNANGWYSAPFAVTFAASDAMSGFDRCDPQKTYSGPDVVSTSLSGSCLDKAGNAGAAAFAAKYDATPPQATASPSRQPNANGWFNAPLTVTFAATDATSTVDSCDPAKSYNGPDVASAEVAGSCRDKAGNVAGTSLSLRYDATAPSTSATPSRQPNAGGWFNAPLSVNFAATDATSTVDSCNPAKSYAGPDSASAAVSGACLDKAGNLGVASLPLKYDATAPSTSAAPSRQPNANGWYNAPLTIGFAATDATSTVDSCDSAKSYAGPDAASTQVAGSCRDKAGNAGSASFPLKYDGTAPAAAATPSRQPNANGWYNAPLTVAFSATDATSGLDSCPAARAYAGPDNAGAVVSGTCLDRAGNGGLAALALRYDATAPQANASSRDPDRNGWYSRPLTVSVSGADVTSGVDTCTSPQDYAGPDTASVSRSGSCRDRAGNPSAETSFAFKYDATAPLVTNATAVRPPDHGEWFNRPIAFAVQGQDAIAGLDGICPTAVYAGPDGAGASISGTCVDRAGNVGSRSFPLKFDGTGPDVTAGPSRAPDANGWYNQPLTVGFAGADAVSGLESCTGPESYGGPDSPLVVVAGFCLDHAGNAGVASLPVQFDATPPQITGATPRRAPDANGWYNHPLVVGFHGTDATSAIEACTEATYAGPDAGAASLTGLCRDHAGNTSTHASFALRYDATAPSLIDVRVKASNRAAVLSWEASADAILVEVLRSGKTVYRGSERTFRDARLQNGVRYRYTVNAYDEAHNAATDEVTARPTAPLFAPAAGATVTAPPRLAWVADEKATHYHVQVWRRGRIFSAWPKGTSVRLRRTWIYDGRRQRLTPGTYRWYVWPGYGRPAQRKYGPLLGVSSFVVRAAR